MDTALNAIDEKTSKALTDEYLKAFCQRRSADALKLGPSYFKLWQSIEKLLLAGGKRFRPYMVLATYRAYHPDGSLEDVLPAAVAQELIHMAMLIHDDIIDRDSIRYGIKNISGQYEDFYGQYLQDASEKSHMSLSAALLAGDVLISDAYQLLRKTKRPSDLIDQAEEVLTKAIFEVIGGELMDTEVAFLPKGSISAFSIAKYKTASYSFMGPLTIGAILAKAPEADVETLRELSELLGIGYQLRDDLLGMFGDEGTIGKSTSTDIKEGKRTFLIEQFEVMASEKQIERFVEIFHRQDITNQEAEMFKALLIESGAKATVENKIEAFAIQARQSVARLALSEDSKRYYNLLIKTFLSREI